MGHIFVNTWRIWKCTEPKVDHRPSDHLTLPNTEQERLFMIESFLYVLCLPNVDLYLITLFRSSSLYNNYSTPVYQTETKCISWRNLSSNKESKYELKPQWWKSLKKRFQASLVVCWSFECFFKSISTI